MVISIVLNTEYMEDRERNKWFLKSVSNAIKEDTLIITHACFKDNLEKTISECADRFYEEFEMERVPVSEIKKMDICYIPDELFDSIYQKCGSKTKQILYLYNNSVPEIEDYISLYINKALKYRGLEKPSLIFNCLHVFEFVRNISRRYNCPIIPYVFSAIRKVHGYSQTLYMAHIDDDLFNSDACRKMYDQYDGNETFPILSKMEILLLLGKKHNFPLIPLMQRVGRYEVGVIGEGFHISPEIYQNDQVTDDDIYYDIQQYFSKDKIVTRQHPMRLDQVGVGRTHIKNDPAAFLLDCNYVVTVQSQMIIKAALWSRRVATYSNALPYSFLLNRNIRCAKIIDDKTLNFIIFTYFVPDSCMFSEEYWKWRINNPSTKCITIRHIKEILSNLGINEDLLKLKKERLFNISEARGLNKSQIENYLNDVYINNVSYEYPTSCLICHMKNGEAYDFYSLNHVESGYIKTEFFIPKGMCDFAFIPQNDLDGYVSVDKIELDGNEIDTDIQYKYFNKNEAVMCVDLDDTVGHKMVALWRVESYR